MRINNWIFILVGITLALACCNDINEEATAIELVNKCKELKIGMPYSVVIENMGQPINVVEIEKEGNKKKRLYFPSPRLSSTFIQCVIDVETNLVEEIICGEDYRIMKKLGSTYKH